MVALGGFDGIEVTRAGLREGVFFRARLVGGEPLLLDVRAASFATSRSCTAHASLTPSRWRAWGCKRTTRFADARRRSCKPTSERLLRPAAMLHDLGMAVGYDGHQGHSHYLILGAGLAGSGRASWR